MNDLKVIRYLIEGIVQCCDCEMSDADFQALRWLFRQHEYQLIREETEDEDGENA